MKLSDVTSYLSYFLLWTLLYPFSLLSYKTLHAIGKKGGVLLFFLVPKYRKRTLSNLSLAKDLPLSEADRKVVAKASLGNLLITALEYRKLAREKNIESLVTCKNPEVAKELLLSGKGVIFFCGHQANWELFFLEGTKRMPGVAIGQPIKNRFLYRKVLSIREKFGGKIVLPEQSVKEGLRALKQGKFLGIVGDQGMPETGLCFPFLGTPAWTSTLPALLSYRSGRPILTATMKREENGTYTIVYSDPVWPDTCRPSQEEIPRLLQEAVRPLEAAILQTPEQWLWQHNRWKQQKPGKIRRSYRYDAIAVILPKDSRRLSYFLEGLQAFRTYYPRETISVFTPAPLPEGIGPFEERIYSDRSDIAVSDYRYKLVFHFGEDPSLRAHFLRLSAFRVVDFQTLQKESKCPTDSPFSLILQGALTRGL